MAPIIPLNRVLPDPEARLRRFGVNDSQLFGKPILEPLPEVRPAVPRAEPLRKPAAKSPALEAPSWDPGTGSQTRKSNWQDTQAVPGYRRWTAIQSAPDSAPRAGLLLDVEG